MIGNGVVKMVAVDLLDMCMKLMNRVVLCRSCNIIIDLFYLYTGIYNTKSLITLFFLCLGALAKWKYEHIS